MANVESGMGHVMRGFYLLAVAVASVGWLWFLVWVAARLV